MGFKTFCDHCKKEIKDGQNYYVIGQRGNNFDQKDYCSSCFKKYCKLPKRAESRK